MGSGEGPTMRNFLICTVHFIYLGVIKSRRLRMEEGRSAFKILKGKPTGKRTLGRPRRRWEDNIRMDLKEVAINIRNWIDSVQESLVNAALNLGFHKPWS